MKKYPKVSLLMLNWNGIEFTKKSINSLLSINYPNYEILVLDNGSQNKEADEIDRIFKGKIKLVRNKKNVGYARGMNILYKHTKEKYIMFLNNDMKFDKNFLLPLVEVLVNDKSVGACQPKVKDLKNKKYFEYAAAAGGYIDIFGYPFARGRIFSDVERDKGQYDQEVIVAWGGVTLVRRKALEKNFIYDPIFFNYSEDVDLCYRMYGKGYKVVFNHNSIVYHYGGGVLGKDLGKKMFFIHRNHLILILKDWELRTLAWLIWPRIFLDIVSFFYYLFTGFPQSAAAIIKAYLSLFLMLPQIYKSRVNTQKKINRKHFSQMPIYKGSIVLDYFLFKKRTFADILKNNPSFKNSIFNNLWIKI